MKRLVLIGLVLALAAPLGGCVVVPRHGYGARPYAGAHWVPRHYNRAGYWVRGHWA